MISLPPSSRGGSHLQRTEFFLISSNTKLIGGPGVSNISKEMMIKILYRTGCCRKRVSMVFGYNFSFSHILLFLFYLYITLANKEQGQLIFFQ